MKKRAAVMVGAAILTGLAGCMDLNEDVISGLTPGAYGTEAAFQALVNATYEPLRSLDRKSTRLNSSHSQISYAVFCLKKKKMTEAHILRVTSIVRDVRY